MKLGGLFDIEILKKRIEELEGKMQETGFWNDLKLAQSITQEAKSLKDKYDRFAALEARIEDIEILIELSSSEDDESEKLEIISEIQDISREIEKFRIETMLSGQYDRDNAIFTLHAGVGGTDAQDWTEMLLRMYSRWCADKGYKIET